MIFDSSSLNNFLLIAAAWGGAFLAALWLSLLVWTYRDIRSRAKDLLVRILAVLVVAVLFLLEFLSPYLGIMNSNGINK